MGRYTGPKNKLSRREGKDLFGNGGRGLEQRLGQPPGPHGRGPQRRNDTDYGRQLRAKQMVKRMYGMREDQFRRFFAMAARSRGLTGLSLLQLLERRLDNVVYRLGFARTRLQARQLVNHGHILVDGHRVNIPSYLVEPEQVIALKEDARQIPDVRELLDETVYVPEWLERRDGTGRVVRPPERREIDQEIQEQLIVEFYSR